jgi:hypothetical protein
MNNKQLITAVNFAIKNPIVSVSVLDDDNKPTGQVKKLYKYSEDGEILYIKDALKNVTIETNLVVRNISADFRPDYRILIISNEPNIGGIYTFIETIPLTADEESRYLGAGSWDAFRRTFDMDDNFDFKKGRFVLELENLKFYVCLTTLPEAEVFNKSNAAIIFQQI